MRPLLIGKARYGTHVQLPHGVTGTVLEKGQRWVKLKLDNPPAPHAVGRFVVLSGCVRVRPWVVVERVPYEKARAA